MAHPHPCFPAVPCTCPLCTLDRRSCVTTSEGAQLAKEFGATYLELHAPNDFYIQKYFGGVVSVAQFSPTLSSDRGYSCSCVGHLHTSLPT